ncbi:ATP-binding protein [Streptacidiphilus sp. PB12-B1b]|uniref:ATP-binding protein n=1 Tax=Streptacidiphilus sp. PB12-B1b TaxID=2705012 RepID=UPI0015FC5D74|nr:ATP-binding protein [Streptacidiphilus sp. PB12-B1b]QMU76296.1 ATP-binding protein [Streptacidiphilus sp. PB12-B1b]
MLSDPGKHYELRIVAEPHRFAAVRKIVQAHLRHWELPELVAAAQLGVTELLGNVHRHVGPGQECRLRMEAHQGGLRLAVRDPSPVLPQLCHPDVDDLSGRGLALVAALSKEWGAEPDGSGKTVWFALQTPVRLDPAPGGAGSDARTGPLAPDDPDQDFAEAASAGAGSAGSLLAVSRS